MEPLLLSQTLTPLSPLRSHLSPFHPTSLAAFESSFEYDGNATCAADGMCQEKCPVKINTGDLIKHIRSQELAQSSLATGSGMWLADNFKLINNSVPTLLNVVNAAHKVGGR